MDKAGDILKAFLSFYNIEGGEKYASLFSSWRKIAGDDIACHSRIVDLRRGALIVEVDHPGWMQVLQMKREEILKKLAEKYSSLGIRMLHTKLAKDGQFSLPPEIEDISPPPAESIPDPPESSAAGDFREKTDFENIHDEELKESLVRLKKTLKEKKK